MRGHLIKAITNHFLAVYLLWIGFLLPEVY